MKFKEDLNHKHVNQVKKNPTKHVNMVYINCEQDHIDNEIKHIHKSHAMNNIHISIKKEKINTRTKLNTYLHECTLQWKNTLEIKEIFTSFRSKIFFTYKKEILKAKSSRTSLT